MHILAQKTLITGSSSSITKKRVNLNFSHSAGHCQTKEKMYGQKNLEEQVGLRCNSLLKMHNIQFYIFLKYWNF